MRGPNQGYTPRLQRQIRADFLSAADLVDGLSLSLWVPLKLETKVRSGANRTAMNRQFDLKTQEGARGVTAYWLG